MGQDDAWCGQTVLTLPPTVCYCVLVLFFASSWLFPWKLCRQLFWKCGHENLSINLTIQTLTPLDPNHLLPPKSNQNPPNINSPVQLTVKKSVNHRLVVWPLGNTLIKIPFWTLHPHPQISFSSVEYGKKIRKQGVNLLFQFLDEAKTVCLLPPWVLQKHSRAPAEAL